MKERIICFALGLSHEDIEKGRASFYGLNKETHALEVIDVTEAMLASKVGEILDNVIADSGLTGAEKRQGGEHSLSTGLYPYRMVMVNTTEHQQVLQVMRSFKAVLPDPQNMIFAVITDTARTWTFGDYVGHLGMEHEYMKTHDPKDDPDRKRK